MFSKLAAMRFLLVAAMIFVVLASILGCGGNTYEIVQSDNDAVGGLDRIVAESQFVDEDQVKIIAQDLEGERSGEALLVITNEGRTDRVQALINFDDGSYEMR